MDTGDTTQGVFFVTAAGTASQVAILGQNKPAELLFLIPTLAAGDYTVEVRAIMHNSTDLRTGTLAAILIVA